MPYSSTQQAKLDVAQKRNDAAKTNWEGAKKFWQQHFIDLKCYSDTKWDAVAAATWFTPNDSSCTVKGSCTSSDKATCKSEIALVRDNIASLRTTYTELGAAQANYDKVFAEVTAEAQNDPAFITAQNQIAASAQANKLKWVFGIVVVVVISFGIYAYFKWFRK